MLNIIHLVTTQILFFSAIAMASEEVVEPHYLLTVIEVFLPFLLFLSLWLFFMRRSFGKNLTGKGYMDRASEHMEVIEASNKKQEELLNEIVILLKDK